MADHYVKPWCLSLLVYKCITRAHFLSLAQSKLRLCSTNLRAGYFSNLACDWLSIVWAYSEQETENGPGLNELFSLTGSKSDLVPCLCVITRLCHMVIESAYLSLCGLSRQWQSIVPWNVTTMFLCHQTFSVSIHILDHLWIKVITTLSYRSFQGPGMWKSVWLFFFGICISIVEN